MTAVALSFPSDRTASLALSFALDVEGASEARVERLSYEVWLEGRRFASGVELLDRPLESDDLARFTVTVPLSFRPASMREGATGLLVELKGALHLSGEDGRAFAFRGGVVADPAPDLAAPTSE